MKTLRQMIQDLLSIQGSAWTTLEIRREFAEFTPREVDSTLWELVNEGWALLVPNGAGPLLFSA